MDGALRQIQRIVREAPALELERFLTPQREGGIDLVSEIRAFTSSALPERPGRQSVRVDMVRMTQQQVVAAHRLIAAIDQMRAAIRPHLA